MNDGNRPSDSYTLADLEFLTLRAMAHPRTEIIEAFGGQLDPREIAERTLARASDDADTLRALADSSYIEVRREVAGNRATPAEVVRGLALSDDGITVEKAVVHSALSLADLEFIFQVGVEWARAWLLRNPLVPQRILELATDDASANVRAAVACHPRVTAAVLGRLALDTDPSVRAAVARHPRLPVLAFTVLAADDGWVRVAVAENPAIPEDALARLAGDDDSIVRRAAAQSPAITPAIAERLAADDNWMVQQHLARNSSCPAATLTALARRDRAVQVRTAVAQNPACPMNVRRRLATQDRSAYVRRFATSWLSQGQ